MTPNVRPVPDSPGLWDRFTEGRFFECVKFDVSANGTGLIAVGPDRRTPVTSEPGTVWVGPHTVPELPQGFRDADGRPLRPGHRVLVDGEKGITGTVEVVPCLVVRLDDPSPDGTVTRTIHVWENADRRAAEMGLKRLPPDPSEPDNPAAAPLEPPAR